MGLEHDADLDLYAGAGTDPLELPADLDFGDSADDELETADAPETDEPAADDGADAEPAESEPAADAEPDAADEAQPEDAGKAGDEEAEPEEVEDKPKKGEPRIPKSRLDQALRKQRMAEARAAEIERELAELRAAQAEASRPKPLAAEDIQAKMAEANEALVAGDPEKAARLQAELLSAIAARPEAEAKPAERDLVAEVEQRLEFKAVVKEVYDRFPELDENGELFNEDLGAESVVLQQSYMQRGYTPAEATRKAAEAIAKLHDLEDRQAQPAKAAEPAAKRVQEAKTREKIAKATKAPPPLTGKAASGDESSVDINRLSEDEFMALPEAVRNRLLGMTV